MSTPDPKIFKAYDIRGLYPEQLNEETIVPIMKAIYTSFSKSLNNPNFSVAIGRDMRTSSPKLHEIAKNTLVEMGAHVIDIGLVTTPTVYFAVLHYGYDAGIQISASHNPKQYNGIKFVRKEGNKLVKIGKLTGMSDVKDMAINGNFVSPAPGGKAEIKENLLDEELETAVNHVKPEYIKNIKIVADPANAMGSLYLEKVARRFNLDMVKINWELDGTFPNHEADPLVAKNFVQLQKKVLEEKAMAGIMPDGDGDRIMFVDEKGKIIPATMITALVAKEVLKHSPGEKILVDIRYIRNTEEVVKQLGGKLSISPVGHALITEQLNRENGIFAGESSGHYYYRETGGAESAIRTLLYVLEVMAREQKPLSEILKGYLTSIESGETNFELNPEYSAKMITDQMERDYSDGDVSKLDGVAISYPDWRFSIRSSNTEPLLRLNVEGKNKELVNQKVEELKKKILATGATIKH